MIDANRGPTLVKIGHRQKATFGNVKSSPRRHPSHLAKLVIDSEISETLREKLRQLTAEQALAVSNEVKEAVREFFPNDKMAFPAQMLIVTGTRRDHAER